MLHHTLVARTFCPVIHLRRAQCGYRENRLPRTTTRLAVRAAGRGLEPDRSLARSAFPGHSRVRRNKRRPTRLRRLTRDHSKCEPLCRRLRPYPHMFDELHERRRGRRHRGYLSTAPTCFEPESVSVLGPASGATVGQRGAERPRRFSPPGPAGDTSTEDVTVAHPGWAPVSPAPQVCITDRSSRRSCYPGTMWPERLRRRGCRFGELNTRANLTGQGVVPRGVGPESVVAPGDAAVGGDGHRRAGRSEGRPVPTCSRLSIRMTGAPSARRLRAGACARTADASAPSRTALAALFASTTPGAAEAAATPSPT